MAESIAILFKSTNWRELSEAVSEIAETTSGLNWMYPTKGKAYSVSLYEYDSWFYECEETEIAQVKNLLGDKPSSILCLELKRSVQNKACEDAEKICRTLLEKFDGIVDDALGKIWLKNEAYKDQGFLNEYYRNL